MRRYDLKLIASRDDSDSFLSLDELDDRLIVIYFQVLLSVVGDILTGATFVIENGSCNLKVPCFVFALECSAVLLFCFNL